MHWRKLRRALRDAWPLWLGVSGLLVAWIIAYPFASELSQQVRYASGLLEVFGVGLVGWELSQLPKVWGAPTAFHQIGMWWKSLRSAFRRKPEGQTIGVGSATTTATAGGVGWVQTEPETLTLEERVKRLREDLDRLEDRVKAHESDMHSEIERLDSGLEQERKERKAGDDVVQRQAEEATIGDLPFAWVGLLWLLIGIVFGSFTGEVAALLSPLAPWP